MYRYPYGLELSHTWSYTPHLENADIEYAQIWCLGKTLEQVCPEHLKDRWHQANEKAAAHLKAFDTAKINLDEICFYDSVPSKFLIDFYSLKNQITDWVFEHYKKPNNYELMRDMSVLIHKIKNQTMNLRIKNLNFIDPKVRKNFNKIKECNDKIIYDLWGTATGRLSTAQHSFPILTLNRELRSIIAPNNDLFVELDFNSAELRAFLGLLGEEQPEIDLHAWISENVFDNKFNREQTKKKVFGWLYNPKAKNKKLNEKFDRDRVLDKYYRNGSVHTPFSRVIEVEEAKALNYTIQSTASDLFLTSMLKIDKMLEGRKSYISFSIHDSLILDFAKEDQDIVGDLLQEFSSTKFGFFKTNLSVGKNFGEMRRIQ